MATDATTIWISQRSEVAKVFNELVRESLHFLWPIILAVVYVWALVVIVLAEAQSGWSYIILTVLGFATWVSNALSRHHLRWAIIAYLGGLTVCVSLITLQFRSITALYLYSQIVIIAATLTNPRSTWATAAAASVLVVALGRACGLPTSALLLPMGFVVFTALTSWVASRRLLTALDWALNMSQQSQKSAEEARMHRAELHRVLVSLDDAYVRLERANEALIVAREAAEKAYRFKAEFVANVSHELRTPLNLIVGFSEMMATAPESYGGIPMPNQYRGDVTAIYRSAKHLSDLINDVLDLSQIESGMMPLVQEPTSLTEITCEAIEIVKGLAEARGLRLELDIPNDLPMLMLDRTRIRQVFLNLLSNALRFTQEGYIRVCVHVQGGEATVSVADTGCGIAPDKLARAFESFSQMSEEQSRTGSGLGLAISKKFVELHGGRMWLESKLGHGTIVYFSLGLPYDGREARISPLVRSAARHVRRAEPRVLVLHDDIRTLDVLRRHIQGCQFVFADSIPRAAQIVRNEVLAAVVMDLPDGKGQQDNAGLLMLPPHIPLIACPLPSMRRIGVLLGAADYLPKPVTRQALSDAVARLPHPPHTVLVVDDDVHIVRLIARMLKACDSSLRILKAFGGNEGLDVARTEHPDVILLDLYMPGTTGYDLLERLAADEKMTSTQVIIVSVRTVEQESRPIQGEFRLERKAGFTLTEMVQLLQSSLSVVTRSGAMRPANAAAQQATQPG